ncbi:MAG: 16S rRNA (guanine(966)-N(2))-methyltransferase RsmD [Alphaproteobacteria bacterium]|nr:16S rRNA (guanine(966)-N(2))-methyltransferase RsmD [Alphaproteobacteria bacterium]
MRIISGEFRGRALEVPEDETIRPTSDKTRGAIFNILEHRSWTLHPLLPTSHVADVFCGTGALGLEALSRGVKHVTFIDNAKESLTLTKANIAKFKCAERCTLINSEAHKITLTSPQFDLVMMDPPYHKNLVPKVLAAFERQHLLKQHSVIMVETARDEPLDLPASFEKLDERGYGIALVRFYTYGSTP